MDVCKFEGCLKRITLDSGFCQEHDIICAFHPCSDKDVKNTLFCETPNMCVVKQCTAPVVLESRFCLGHHEMYAICAFDLCAEIAVRNTLFCEKHGITWVCKFADCGKLTEKGSWFCSEHEHDTGVKLCDERTQQIRKRTAIRNLKKLPYDMHKQEQKAMWFNSQPTPMF